MCDNSNQAKPPAEDYEKHTIVELSRMIENRTGKAPLKRKCKVFYIKKLQKLDEPKPSRFMSLPRELRDSINEYMLRFSPHIYGESINRKHKEVSVNILRASKQVYREAKPILYSINVPLVQITIECGPPFDLLMRFPANRPKRHCEMPAAESYYFSSSKSSCIQYAADIEWTKKLPLKRFERIRVDVRLVDSNDQWSIGTTPKDIISKVLVHIASVMTFDLACYLSPRSGAKTKQVSLSVDMTNIILTDDDLQKALWPLTYIRNVLQLENVPDQVGNYILEDSTPPKLAPGNGAGLIRRVRDNARTLAGPVMHHLIPEHYTGHLECKDHIADTTDHDARQDLVYRNAMAVLVSDRLVNQRTIDRLEEADQQLRKLLDDPDYHIVDERDRRDAYRTSK